MKTPTRLRCLAGLSSLLLLLALGLWLARPVPLAWAQGVGIFSRPDCTTLTSPVAGSTWCFDSTASVLKVYNGSTYTPVTLTFSGTGPPYAIGGATTSSNQVTITGTFAERNGLVVTSTVQPPAGTNGNLVQIAGTIAEAASGNHTALTGLAIEPPTVTAGAASVTDTATLLIDGKMTATVSGLNYALFSVDGPARFDDRVLVGHGVTAGAETFSLVLSYGKNLRGLISNLASSDQLIGIGTLATVANTVQIAGSVDPIAFGNPGAVSATGGAATFGNNTGINFANAAGAAAVQALNLDGSDVVQIAANAGAARIAPGLQLGTPTGGNKGAGTLNIASAVLTNNVVALKSTGTPTCLSGCGAAPSVIGNDSAMRVTVGAGATTVFLVNFASAWAGAPACVPILNGAAPQVATATHVNSTATGVTVNTVTAPANGTVYTLLCQGVTAG